MSKRILYNIATSTSSSFQASNVSAGTLNLSTGLTTASLQGSNANITTVTVATLLNTNAVSTNISSGTVNLSSGLTTASLQATNANVTTATIATLLNTNAVSTNISSGTANLSTGLTTASLQGSNANITTATVATLLNTNAVSTNVTVGTISATTFTGGSLSLSGNLNVAGTLTTVNITNTNLVNTNVSAGVVVASTSLSATGNSNTIGSIITTGGNVGIGTSAPSNVLQLETTTTAANTRVASLASAIVDNRFRLVTQRGDTTNVDGDIAVRTGLNYNNTTDNAMIRFHRGSGGGGGFISFSTNTDVERLRIAGTSGNVGIGTTAPTTTLDVAGTINASTSVTTSALFSTNLTSTNVVATNVSSGTARITTSLLATGNSNTIGSIITTGGNVGINNTAPSSDLDISCLNTNSINLRMMPTTNNFGTLIFGRQDRVDRQHAIQFYNSGSVGGNFVRFNIHNATVGQTVSSMTISDTGVSIPLNLSVTTSLLATGNSNTLGSIITTGGNVGIGTIAPAYTLDVAGTGRITDTIFTNVTANNLRLTAASDGATLIFFNTERQWRFFQNGAGGGGFLGLQSLVANKGFEIVHTDGGTFAQFFARNNADDSYISMGNLHSVISRAATSTFGTARITTSLLALGNSNTIGSIITTGGNVGIGTSAPAYTLDVAGTFDVSNTNGSLNFSAEGNVGINTAPGSTVKLHILESSATGGNPCQVFLDKQNERSAIQVFGYANSRSNLLIGSNTYLSNFGNIIMRHTGGNAAGWYMLMGSQEDGFNINRATATTTSTTYLSMISSGSITLSILPANEKPNYIRIQRNDNPGVRYHDLEFQTSVTQSSSYIAFKLHDGSISSTGQTEVMRLRADGRVGIGTTAPGYTLDVNGTFDASNTNGSLTFSAGGNVGINTGTPIGKLHTVVNDATAAGSPTSWDSTYAVFGKSSNTGGAVGIGFHSVSGGSLSSLSPNVAWQTMRYRATDHRFIVSGDTTTPPALMITSDGNIGIGTTAPRNNLEITQDSSTTGVLLYSGLHDGGVNRIEMVHVNDSTRWRKIAIQTQHIGGVSQSGRAHFSIQVNTATGTVNSSIADTRFFIHGTSGNIGINTTSPTASLHVSGGATITGALSKGSGTFEINHPILQNKILLHSFIEGPRCDLIYRGKVALENGTATVNIDTDSVQESDCAMTEGTFTNLCANPQFFLQNPNSFNRLRGSIAGNVLTIICEDNTSTDEVYWQVIAERKDPFIKQWDKTNTNGYLVTEHNIE